VPVTVRFVGSGDSFGSGGRFQTCILVDGPRCRVGVDFGASSLIALAQPGIEHNSIDAVLLTHLHGDHAGGVPEHHRSRRPGGRRLILTHMSREMLARAADVSEQCAYDGLVVTL
jgi:ribonuclease BN (tRNA processing enzyme)